MNPGRVYIIAEAGVNHNGSLELAKQLIDAAAVAGADAVKFQTFKSDRIVSRVAPKAEYQAQATDRLESQLEMLQKLELSLCDHHVLIDYCQQKGIQFLSTPFDLDSVDFLARELNLPRLKISSGDLTNFPLLLRASQTGKPMILSTGMSTLGEVEGALGVLAFGYIRSSEPPSVAAFQAAYRSEAGQAALQKQAILLHCTTDYPAPFATVNLKAMDTLRSAFGLPVGYSDHTPGIAVTIAAAARGATAIEKHFTLDRTLPGPDHQASLEPQELTTAIESIRQVELALGTSTKMPTLTELKNQVVVRKSLVAARSLDKGEVFTEQNLAIKRPGNGIPPMEYWNLLGRRATRSYQEDESIEL